MGLQIKKRDEKVSLHVTVDKKNLEFVEELAEKSNSNLSAATNDCLDYVREEYDKGEVQIQEEAKKQS